MSSYLSQVPRITVGVLTSALLWLGVTANASDQSADQFIVRVYSNDVGSEDLLSGRYDAALAKIETSQSLHVASDFAAATNLCVAQIMAGRFDSARGACDEALKSARSSAISTSTWGPPAGGAHQQDVAIAYANRAVLHWLTDDIQSAANDLAQAKRLSPRADFVTRNVAALQSSYSKVVQGKPVP